MAITIVENECEFQDNGFLVTVQADTINEITGVEARKAAIAYAETAGVRFGSVAASGGQNHYVVDARGQGASSKGDVDRMREESVILSRPGAKYRRKILVGGGL